VVLQGSNPHMNRSSALPDSAVHLIGTPCSTNQRILYKVFNLSINAYKRYLLCNNG